jgi:ABC-type Fe3+/spermidine/putrescine transport system ATPase subunit
VTARDTTPAAGDAVIVAIRPERLRIEPAETSVAEDGWNAVEGHVTQGTYLGDQTEYRVDTAQAGEMVVRRQNALGANNGPGLGPGDRVVISWREEANLVLIS